MKREGAPEVGDFQAVSGVCMDTFAPVVKYHGDFFTEEQESVEDARKALEIVYYCNLNFHVQKLVEVHDGWQTLTTTKHINAKDGVTEAK